MDLTDYLRVFRKRWKLVAVAAFVAVAAAAAASALATPQYRAQTQLFVAARGGDDASALLQGSSFTQQRVKSYANIVTSPTVLRPVIEDLGLETSPAELASRVKASAPLDTVLIDVSVDDSSPTRAKAIADAIGKRFIDKVTELEKPTTGGPSPVRVSVIRSAEVPDGPVSPRLTLNLLLGLLAGLVVGVAVSVLRELLDTTVKSTDEVAVLGAPALGTTVYATSKDGKSALVEPNAYTPEAEALRQIRTNLQFVDVDNPPRVVVLTSSLPGEGKTTTSVNLAIAMSMAGVRTILVDADLRRPKIAEYTGLVGAAGLTTVLSGRADLDDVLQPYGDTGLTVLPSGPTPPNPSELLGSQHMAALLATLRERADLVIIDSPPLLPVTDAAVLSNQADGAILVVRHGKATREHVKSSMERLVAVDARLLGAILSMVRAGGSGSYGYGYGYGYGYAPETDESAGPAAAPRHRALVPVQRTASTIASTASTIRSAATRYASSGKR